MMMMVGVEAPSSLEEEGRKESPAVFSLLNDRDEKKRGRKEKESRCTYTKELVER